MIALKTKDTDTEVAAMGWGRLFEEDTRVRCTSMKRSQYDSFSCFRQGDPAVRQCLVGQRCFSLVAFPHSTGMRRYMTRGDALRP